MEKKPAYQSPKVSRLDDKFSLKGQQALCKNGSGNSDGCYDGQSADRVCVDGNGIIN